MQKYEEEKAGRLRLEPIRLQQIADDKAESLRYESKAEEERLHLEAKADAERLCQEEKAEAEHVRLAEERHFQ